MMRIHKVKSHAKVNLSLNIIKKSAKDNMHKVESIVTFIKLADIIQISETRLDKHNIIFDGKHSKGITNINSISKALSLLDKNNYLRGKKYLIRITKNIPQKSGMGGGSMNAASVLKYFIKKKYINYNQAKKLAKKIDSDTILGINNNLKILYSDNSIKELKKKIRFFVVLLKPKFGCSTKKIYSKNKIFSKKQYLKKKRLSINKSDIIKSKNDLENSAFKVYPMLRKLKNSIISLKKGEFVRMTGSGSTIVVYFNSKLDAKKAFKIYKTKLNKNWCILSKII